MKNCKRIKYAIDEFLSGKQTEINVYIRRQILLEMVCFAYCAV